MMNAPRPRRRSYGRVGGGRRGWPLFFYGLVFFVVGLVITIATYAAAASGGRYIISYGPMAVGLFAMIRGLIDVVRSRRSVEQQPGTSAYPGTPAAAGERPGGYSWPSSASPVDGFSGGAGGPGTAAPGFGYADSARFGAAGGSTATPAAAAVSTPMANWYPDPHNASQWRWWDGQAWTGHTHPRG